MLMLSATGEVSLPVLPSFAATLAKPNKRPTCPSYSKEPPMSVTAGASTDWFVAPSPALGGSGKAWLD
jgi:hypothetical protein